MANGKVALVTGGGGGVGQAVVLRLLKDGFTVAAMDISEKGLAEVSERGRDYASSLSVWPCDQTDEKATIAVVSGVEKKLGPIEALVNTIGWVGTTRFEQEDSAYWRKVIAINLEAVLFVTHPVLTSMIARKRGKMVHFASDAGRVGTSGEVVYSATKGGIIALTKSLARENARHNINVNCVSPGPTETPLLKQEIIDNPELIKRMVRLIPFRRVAQPEDQASTVSFLLSPDADYITGQTISVSGGLVMI
jgi:2-hydroxycyclohexanecarboxyl-CoA dehydrogenase